MCKKERRIIAALPFLCYNKRRKGREKACAVFFVFCL